MGDLLGRFQASNSLSASQRQVRENLAKIERFLREMDIREPGDITQTSIEGFLAWLGAGDKTVLNYKSALSRFCRYLVKVEKCMSYNPCTEIECRRPEVIEPPTMSRARAGRLLWVARRLGLAAEVAVALFAGLRRAELCRLAWADVDFDRCTISVPVAKGRVPRVIPMAAALWHALHNHRRKALAGGCASIWLFPARHGVPGGYKPTAGRLAPKSMGKRLKPLQAAFPEFQKLQGCAVGRGWHLLRHTFATRLAEQNVHILKMQKWLGHTDIRMTERYTHLARIYDPDIERVTR